MHVIFSDAEDHGLHCAVVEEVYYDSIEKMLVIETPSSMYAVHNMEWWDANALIKELFINGKLDASGYRASPVMDDEI